MQGFLSKPLTDVFNAIVTGYTDRLVSHLVSDVPALKQHQVKIKESLSRFNVDRSSKLSVGFGTVYKGIDVVIVLNYTDKSHALFGKFGTIASTLLESRCKENKSLAFGHGFVFSMKELTNVVKIIKDASLTVKQVPRQEYTEVLSGKTPPDEVQEPEEANDEHHDNDDDNHDDDNHDEGSDEVLKPIKPRANTKKTAAPVPKKQPPSKGKAKKVQDEDE